MKTNPIKQKLREGRPTFGTWLSLGNLLATRVLARMGFDWLTLDMEHQAFDWSQAAMIFATIADAGCVPLARVPEGSHHYIKRVLDAGIPQEAIDTMLVKLFPDGTDTLEDDLAVILLSLHGR